MASPIQSSDDELSVPTEDVREEEGSDAGQEKDPLEAQGPEAEDQEARSRKGSTSTESSAGKGNRTSLLSSDSEEEHKEKSHRFAKERNESPTGRVSRQEEVSGEDPGVLKMLLRAINEQNRIAANQERRSLLRDPKPFNREQGTARNRTFQEFADEFWNLYGPAALSEDEKIVILGQKLKGETKTAFNSLPAGIKAQGLAAILTELADREEKKSNSLVIDRLTKVSKLSFVRVANVEEACFLIEDLLPAEGMTARAKDLERAGFLCVLLASKWSSTDISLLRNEMDRVQPGEVFAAIHQLALSIERSKNMIDVGSRSFGGVEPFAKRRPWRKEQENFANPNRPGLEEEQEHLPARKWTNQSGNKSFSHGHDQANAGKDLVAAPWRTLLVLDAAKKVTSGRIVQIDREILPRERSRYPEPLLDIGSGSYRKTLDEMLSKGVAEPSSSPYASPVVLVKKKDAGYWQIPLTEKAKEVTAFTTSEGLFQFTVLPFGLATSPPTFQRMMEIVLKDLIRDGGLSAAEVRYGITELEALGVIHAVRKFHQFIYGIGATRGELSPKVMRWALDVQRYQINLEYVKGKANVVADALSRGPTQILEIDPNDQDYVVAAVKLELDRTEDEQWLAELREDQDWTEAVAAVEQANDSFSLKLPGIEKDLTINHLEVQKGKLWIVGLGPFGMHVNSGKLLTVMKKEVYWINMAKDLKEWTRACQGCFLANPHLKLTPPLKPIEANKPLQLVGVDIADIGPSHNGNRKTVIRTVGKGVSPEFVLSVVKLPPSLGSPQNRTSRQTPAQKGASTSITLAQMLEPEWECAPVTNIRAGQVLLHKISCGGHALSDFLEIGHDLPKVPIRSPWKLAQMYEIFVQGRQLAQAVDIITTNRLLLVEPSILRLVHAYRAFCFPVPGIRRTLDSPNDNDGISGSKDGDYEK
ncbi:unnamed protein product [Caenorhabditis auriculariae]|uniref:RNA-directed DNA polymerase n=1 Tax=Caenorhabditis auriculariae TaxID=2777116 RepID=A0A8S1HTY2_9PELO|nr:unnamed protein product [Caenorhabditis auriculariae]